MPAHAWGQKWEDHSYPILLLLFFFSHSYPIQYAQIPSNLNEAYNIDESMSVKYLWASLSFQ